MADLFEPEEEELIEICDASGKRSAMRRLVTLSFRGKVYLILGSTDDEEEDGLLLVREDETVDGVQEYVITEDEHEIEEVVGRFITYVVSQIGEHMEAEADEDEEADEEPCACGMMHGPSDFCFCDDEDYLQ